MIYKLLLIDIGGTNMRHAIASSDSNEITNICKTTFTDMDEFEEKLKDLIDNHGIDILITSVAGPKVNNSISMTNRNYVFDRDEISHKFNLKDCYLLNDWEAIAYSHDFIKDSIESIKIDFGKLLFVRIKHDHERIANTGCTLRIAAHG